MDKQSPQGQISAKQSDSKSIREWVDFLSVSKHNGWVTYEQKLKGLIDNYTVYMENVLLSPELLKSYQLIKKGLVMALNIPKTLEIKAKSARKSVQRETRSRSK